MAAILISGLGPFMFRVNMNLCRDVGNALCEPHHTARYTSYVTVQHTSYDRAASRQRTVLCLIIVVHKCMDKSCGLCEFEVESDHLKV